MKSSSHAGAICVLTCLASLAGGVRAARADWWVRNNLSETFTVYVWPVGASGGYSEAEIPPGALRRLQTGVDRHNIELLSAGGDLYVLEPANLNGRPGETLLKTILTPKGRRNGRIVYQYMNQEGFDQGDESRPGNLQWSVWRTTYSTPGGGGYTTNLRFLGDVGTYDGGRGRLSGVTYTRSGNRWVVSGTWSHGRSSNRFQFFVDPSENSFSSRQDGGKSSWDGERRWALD